MAFKARLDGFLDNIIIILIFILSWLVHKTCKYEHMNSNACELKYKPRDSVSQVLLDLTLSVGQPVTNNIKAKHTR